MFRRELLPLADCAREFMAAGARESGSLANALRVFLLSQRGVDVPEDAWRWPRLEAKLAPYLLMNFRVIGADGACLEQGRDLVRLQARLAGHSQADLAPAANSGFAREGLRDWLVGTLPRVMEERSGGRLVRGYPALVAREDAVALDLFASAEAAEEVHAGGVRRLFALGASREIRKLTRAVPHLEAMELMYAMLAPAPDYVVTARTDAHGLGRAIMERAVQAAMPSAGVSQGFPSYQTSGKYWTSRIPGL